MSKLMEIQIDFKLVSFYRKCKSSGLSRKLFCIDSDEIYKDVLSHKQHKKTSYSNRDRAIYRNVWEIHNIFYES